MNPKTKNNVAEIPPFLVPVKRISHRLYPSRKCKKTDCQIDFTPTSKREKYCCPQHRVDHNNDQRDLKAKPGIEFEKKLQHNQMVLKKIFEKLGALKLTCISADLLIYESYYFDLYTDKQINTKSGMEVSWNYYFGIEGNNEKNQLL